MTKRWVGRWILAVGIVHCVFGAIVFFDPISAIVLDGIWNAVDGHPGRPLAFWFEVVGLLTVLFGIAIDSIEKDRNSIPALIGYGFGALTVLAVVAMPVGGGWLLVPGAVGLWLKRSQ